MLDLLPEILPNILQNISNWGRWSEMVVFKLFDVMSGWITFKNALSIIVLKWLVIRVGCEIKVINELEARESKNWFSDNAHYNSRG